MKILFMCVANSARSQMAEGLAKSLFPSTVEVESAGSHPKYVHPLAKKALSEIGIDISSQSSKSWDQLPVAFRDNLDLIITLCAEEVCPVVKSDGTQKLHWRFSDPASINESEDLQLKSFRQVRDQIKTKLQEFRNSTLRLNISNENI